MIKTIIANYGPGGQGKSSTIMEVYRQLQRHFPNLSPAEPLIDDIDIKAIFTINSIKIGLESQGDPYSRQGESLQEFERENCSIIIVACRTKGETCNNINELGKKGYRIIWAQNYICYDQSTNFTNLNNMYAQGIVNIVDEIINNNL